MSSRSRGGAIARREEASRSSIRAKNRAERAPMNKNFSRRGRRAATRLCLDSRPASVLNAPTRARAKPESRVTQGD